MKVILAKPRGFCAGVVRAVEIVQRALELFGPPVFVLHEIVHNQRVVSDLRGKGAIFVESLASLPAGSTIILSAHGVAPSDREEAERRAHRLIDATCPLVAKVHLEVAGHALAGRDVILIGHRGHVEVAGTVGHYGDSGRGRIHVVESVGSVGEVQVRDSERVAFVTQTTLSVDDTAEIRQSLRRRFPAIRSPRIDDICYATQNRQAAVKALAGQVEVVLVVGARNSSNSNRLREVAERSGTPAYLVQDAAELAPDWIDGCETVGVTAGASTPEVLVRDLLDRLRLFGAASVEELVAEEENVSFRLPVGLRRTARQAVEA